MVLQLNMNWKLLYQNVDENENSYHTILLCVIAWFRVQYIVIFRDGSRTAAASKMERFVIIVNGFQLQAVNYYHEALHLRCCSSPRSVSDIARLTLSIFNVNEAWNIEIYLFSDLVVR